jgi:hypothetical protein
MIFQNWKTAKIVLISGKEINGLTFFWKTDVRSFVTEVNYLNLFICMFLNASSLALIVKKNVYESLLI